MWYVASLIRGMSIDEAIRQLSFVSKKGAGPVKESLLEAQELAVKRHNVEYKSNLWVGEYTPHQFHQAFVFKTYPFLFQLNRFVERAKYSKE